MLLFPFLVGGLTGVSPTPVLSSHFKFFARATLPHTPRAVVLLKQEVKRGFPRRERLTNNKIIVKYSYYGKIIYASTVPAKTIKYLRMLFTTKSSILGATSIEKKP